jgi:hypothetical protein
MLRWPYKLLTNPTNGSNNLRKQAWSNELRCDALPGFKEQKQK